MALNVRFERVSDKLDLELSAEVIHLWSISLSTSAEGTRVLRRLLSSAECEQADRFHFEADRQRFIAARAVLRSLLASYTNRRAEELTFHYNSSGKPRLVGGGKHVEFNLAHSEAQALYGFRVDHSIGVDIEVIQPYDDFLTMADKYFAREEYVSVASSPEQERNELFLQYWTLKEAVVKATGMGLVQLGDFRLNLLPNGEAVVEPLIRGKGFDTGWFARSFKPLPGYMGALAGSGALPEVIAHSCAHLDDLFAFLAAR